MLQASPLASALDLLISIMVKVDIPHISSVLIAAASLYVALYFVANVTSGSGMAADLLGLRPKDKAGNHIPTGPIGLPIVGSFPFLTHNPEKTLDSWYQRFGPLYSMWLGDQLFVVVSDPGIAKDLLVTNGSVFSSRKDMYIKSQTIFAR